MKMNVDENRKKMAEWFDELECYAKEKRLPMRIMDELEDCRESALSGEADWNTVCRSVENLLENIMEKNSPAIVREKTENEVSPEAVRAEIEKMARRCHTENMASVDSMRERKNAAVKKAYGQLSEISYTKAHLKELKNEDLYLQFITRCKDAYERDIFGMLKDLLKSISSNYAYMMDQMKSMLQSIGGYKNIIGNETFYLMYEERKDSIDKSVQAESETADVGGSSLISFGQKTKDTIKNIVKKLVRKRKLLAWVPLFVMFCLLTVGIVANQKQNKQETERVETADGSNGSEIKEFVKEAVKKAAGSVIEKSASAVVNFFLALIIDVGLMLIFILLLIGLLYMCYLIILKRWCDRQIGKRCGEYLNTELFKFEQENSLSPKVDTAIQNAVDEYERQYMETLQQMFAKTSVGAQDEKTEWDALREKWNEIKYR